MRARVEVYVYSVGLAAVVQAVAVYVLWPQADSSRIVDVAILSVLAIVGEMLGFALPKRSAKGSISFIPFFAAVVLAPNWHAIAAAVFVKTGFEIAARRDWIKSILNVASYALTIGAAVIVYRLLGGESLFAGIESHTLTQLSSRDGLAAIAAFTTAFLINSSVVITAIAMASGRPVLGLLFESTRSSILMDLVTAPLVFVFAWVYSKFGPIAAGALWVPILGLRQVYLINIELETTNEELLELMVKSIEARDPYTSGHSRRVQHYSTIIARAIGLREKDISEVGQAALLHDVGKIYEKYAPVISKQDKLTAEEWAIIKDHPVDGANLVSTMTRLRWAVPAIRGHHENWDGTGYPDGLVGDVIPVAARIIRFADTIDAMTTERPYRKPLTEAQVRAEIIRCRGTQFDPEIADRLLASPLYQTLFAPSSTERSIVPLSVLAPTPRVNRAQLGTKALKKA